MQPYFFPYIGYWQLMLSCDEWVFFDAAQFKKRSWMTRNRILHSDPAKSFQYINISTQKVSLSAPLSDVVILENDVWRNKIFAQLEFYKRLRAPFYSSTISLVGDILFSDCTSLPDQAERMARAVMSYLGKEIQIKHSAEIEFNLDQVSHAGDWALEISKAVGAQEYINPPGGVDIFDSKKYEKNGVKLKFLRPYLQPYKQSTREFLPGLSIIDVLMFNSPQEVCEMLMRDYEILSQEELVAIGG